MKAVMISIRPQYCELIASGKKTVEVRKTRPKCDMPFKVYIYETKGKIQVSDWLDKIVGGKVIGEFVCDFINEYTAEFVDNDCYEDIRQVWEDEDFTIVTSNEDENPNNCFLCNASCLSFEDIKKHIGVNFHEIPFYGWHISGLVIYDKPRELSEFKRWNRTEDNVPCAHVRTLYEPCETCKECNLTRPPRSWCYVEM